MIDDVHALGEDGVIIHLLPREDGGLRISSPTLRGLVLSGSDAAKVLQDVLPAIAGIRALSPTEAPEGHRR